jgi:ketosteroid isomerase-like protein
MTVDELICKQSCNDLMAELASALDRGDNAAAADCFTHDATMVMPTGEFSGEAVREALARRPAHIVTRHIYTNVIIRPMDAATAEGSAYLLVYRVPRGADGQPSSRLPNTPQAAGDWRLRFRRTPGGWKLSRYEAVVTLTPAE